MFLQPMRTGAWGNQASCKRCQHKCCEGRSIWVKAPLYNIIISPSIILLKICVNFVFTTFRLIALVVGSVYGSKKDDTSLPISNRVNIIAQAAINVAMLSMIKTLQLLKKEKVVGKSYLYCSFYYNACAKSPDFSTFL